MEDWVKIRLTIFTAEKKIKKQGNRGKRVKTQLGWKKQGRQGKRSELLMGSRIKEVDGAGG